MSRPNHWSIEEACNYKTSVHLCWSAGQTQSSLVIDTNSSVFPLMCIISIKLPNLTENTQRCFNVSLIINELKPCVGNSCNWVWECFLLTELLQCCSTSHDVPREVVWFYISIKCNYFHSLSSKWFHLNSVFPLNSWTGICCNLSVLIDVQLMWEC